MRQVIALLLALAAPGMASMSSAILPNEDINAVDTPQVIWVDQNFDSLKAPLNRVIDSMNIYVPGGGALQSTILKSNTNLNARIDADNNATGNKFTITHNGAADTLLSIKDDSTVKVFGSLAVVGAASTGALTPSSITSSSLTGTGTRVVTSTSAGVVGNATTIAGANTWSGAQTINNDLTVNSDGGSAGSWGLKITTSSSGNGVQSLDNIRDFGSNIFRIRMRTAGTPIIGFSMDGGGNVTLPVSLTSTGPIIANDSIKGVNERLTGTLVAAGNITADSLISSKFYTEGTFTGTLQGCATSPTGTVSYVRVGKMVMLKIPEISAVSDSTGMAITGMPSALFPSAEIFLSNVAKVNCLDNSSNTDDCTLFLSSAGVIRYLRGGSFTGFTNSGNKGTTGAFTPRLQTFTYTLQ